MKQNDFGSHVDRIYSYIVFNLPWSNINRYMEEKQILKTCNFRVMFIAKKHFTRTGLGSVMMVDTYSSNFFLRDDYPIDLKKEVWLSVYTDGSSPEYIALLTGRT